MKTITKSARLSMKTKTNTLLGAVLFLLAIFAFALRAHAQEGTLVSWGENTHGEVSGTPAGIFTAVAAGFYHNLAIRSDGTLASWGHNSSGQVSGTPAGTFTAIAAGYAHSLAVRSDGTLASWGDNGFGQVSGTPSGTFNAVAAGTFHSVAMRSDGTLVSWGNDSYGVVSGTPAGTFVTVAANGNRSVAIRANGTLAAWGGPDHYGQVSDIPAGTFVAVACGEAHNVALRSDGTLASWGYGLDGQVSDTPAGTFTAVAAGSYYSVAIRTDGTLVAWGSDSGQVKSGIPAGIFSTIGANIDHAVAIRVPDNQPPLATDDFYGINQASSLSVPAPGVLANDSDSDEDPLTVELVSGPANASSFQLNADGSFAYTSPAFFYGEDTFSYRVSDGTEYSETATVHITVSQPGSQGFITGGGKFFQDGRKCTFGFVAKVQVNGVQGNLEFQDHDASMDVSSEVMQTVYAANSTDGYFGGTCRVNGAAGHTFFVQIHDRGEPGSNDDLTVWIFDSFNNPVYTAGALLSGGNIVIHGH